MTQQQMFGTGASPYAPAPPNPGYIVTPWPRLTEAAKSDEQLMGYLTSLMGTSSDNPRRIAAPLIEALLERIAHLEDQVNQLKGKANVQSY